MNRAVVEISDQNVDLLVQKIGRTRTSNMFWCFVLFVIIVTMTSMYFIAIVVNWQPLIELLEYSESASRTNIDLNIVIKADKDEVQRNLNILPRLTKDMTKFRCIKLSDDRLVIFKIDETSKKSVFFRNGNGVLSWHTSDAAAEQQCEYMLKNKGSATVSCGEEMYAVTGHSGSSNDHVCQLVRLELAAMTDTSSR